MTSTFFGHPFNHHQNTLRNQDFGQIVYIHTWILEAFDLWTLIAAALSAHVDKSKSRAVFSSFLWSNSGFSNSFRIFKVITAQLDRSFQWFSHAILVLRRGFLKLTQMKGITIKKLCSSLATRTSWKSNP